MHLLQCAGKVESVASPNAQVTAALLPALDQEKTNRHGSINLICTMVTKALSLLGQLQSVSGMSCSHL